MFLPGEAFLRTESSSALDMFFNIALYFPLGWLISAAKEKEEENSSCFYSFIFAGTLCFLISSGLELAQFWVPDRQSSPIDIVTNTFGGLLGAAFNYFSLSFLRFSGTKAKAYTVTLLFLYSVLRSIPVLIERFALRIESRSVAAVSLAPQFIIMDGTPGDQRFWALLSFHLLLVMVFGLLSGLLSESKRIAVFATPLFFCLEYGEAALTASSFELLDPVAEALVFFLAFNAADRVFAILSGDIRSLRKRFIHVLYFYSFCYLLFSLWPLNFQFESSQIRDEQLVPFAQMQSGSYANLLMAILLKAGACLPLGIVHGIVVLRSGKISGAVSSLVGQSWVFLIYFSLMEALQLFIPERRADIDGILFAASGYLSGRLLAILLLELHISLVSARLQCRAGGG